MHSRFCLRKLPRNKENKLSIGLFPLLLAFANQVQAYGSLLEALQGTDWYELSQVYRVTGVGNAMMECFDS